MRIQLPALLLLLSIAALTGCGGSSSAPYVSDIQANQLAYAQTTQFSVMGDHLDTGINVTAKGCKSFTTPSAASSSGSTWNCVVDAVGTGAVSVQVSKATGEVLLSKSFDIPAPSTPVVLSIKADSLMYSKSAQFTMTGYSLDKDFNVSTKNCKGLALVSVGSSTSKSVTCNVGTVGTGAISFEAKMADGTVLKSASFDVPNPQVKMVTSLGTLTLELNPNGCANYIDEFSAIRERQVLRQHPHSQNCHQRHLCGPRGLAYTCTCCATRPKGCHCPRGG